MIELKDIVFPAVGLVVAFLIWNLKRTMDRRDTKIDVIEKDIHQIKESLPKDYVSKDDYKTDISSLKSGIDDIRKFIMEKGSKQ